MAPPIPPPEKTGNDWVAGLGAGFIIIVLFIIGWTTWGPNTHSSHVKTVTVTHYITVTRQTEEATALRNCYTIANAEEDARIYGKCVLDVEKGFSR